MTKTLMAVFGMVACALGPCGAETLIPPGAEAEWRFLAAGKAPKNDWKSRSFDDNAWLLGRAPLGYGEAGLETDVWGKKPAGPRPMTSWFRRSFDASAGGKKNLVLMLRADDGAAVFLNGRELARHNLPADAGPEDAADSAVSDADELAWHRFEIQAVEILAGRNVLAVEVHQCDPESSDLYFDLSLRAVDGNGTGTAELHPAAREVTLQYFQNHHIGPELRVADGYVDGGRRMVIGKDGKIVSGREILVIDRSRDPALRRHLEFAGDPKLRELSVLERAKRLAIYVDKALSPPSGRDAAMDAVERFTTEYANRPVLFGEMESVCRAGVCRHRALLFKILADEAGLRTAVVRGNFVEGRSSGGHAWNELLLDDGACLIVDIMNPPPGFVFPPDSDPDMRRYVSAKNEPLYPKRPGGAK